MLKDLIAPHQLEQRFGGSAPNCEAPEDFYPYRFFPDGPDETEVILSRIPKNYLSSGLLWETRLARNVYAFLFFLPFLSFLMEF